ncbi:hypothetical protein QJQ45_019431 [Haematococcus lacustris]|nr:hypothetical protein QJQ45_019431 [Haematococcus lacustris]
MFHLTSAQQRCSYKCRASRPDSMAGRDPVLQGLQDFATFIAPSVQRVQKAAASPEVSSPGSSLPHPTPRLRHEDPRPPSQARATRVLAQPARATPWPSSPTPQEQPDYKATVYCLIAVNCLAQLLVSYLLGHSPSLALHLGRGFAWWQLGSSCLTHTGGWAHLAETSFFIYVFGRPVERAHGAWGLLFAYISSALGAAALSLALLMPAKASSLLAVLSTTSAAAAGLFVAGLFWPRLTRKPLELVCLAPFLLLSTVSRYSALGPGLVVGGHKLGGLVPLVGAVLGASLAAGLLHLMRVMRLREEERRRQEVQEEAQRLRAQQAGPHGSDLMADVLGTTAQAAAQLARKLL